MSNPENPNGSWWFDDPAAGDGEGTRPSRKTWLVGGVGAAAIAIAAVVGINTAASSSSADTTATAAGPRGFGGPGVMPGGLQMGGQVRGPAAIGTIDRIAGDAITVADQNGGTTEVTPSSDTEVTIASEGDLDDLDQGDEVVVIGSPDGDGLAAERITETAAHQAGPPGLGGVTAGTVESIDGTELVVRTGDGDDVRVTTSDDTTVTTVEQGSVDYLAEGDHVVVEGTADDPTAIRAGEVGRSFGPPPMMPGQAQQGQQSQQSQQGPTTTR